MMICFNTASGMPCANFRSESRYCPDAEFQYRKRYALRKSWLSCHSSESFCFNTASGMPCANEIAERCNVNFKLKFQYRKRYALRKY